MKIRPLQDRIIVKRIDEEETTAGGIIIPDTAKEKPQEGKVTAVGNGKVGEDGKVTPLDVKKGDKVLFGKYSGNTSRKNPENENSDRPDVDNPPKVIILPPFRAGSASLRGKIPQKHVRRKGDEV